MFLYGLFSRHQLLQSFMLISFIHLHLSCAKSTLYLLLLSVYALISPFLRRFIFLLFAPTSLRHFILLHQSIRFFCFFFFCLLAFIPLILLGQTFLCLTQGNELTSDNYSIRQHIRRNFFCKNIQNISLYSLQVKARSIGDWYLLLSILDNYRLLFVQP